MSVTDNKRVVCEFLEHMNKGEAEAGLALLAPDAIWWAPGDRKGGIPHTTEQMRGFVAAFYAAFATPPHMEVLELTGEDDRVAVRLSTAGGVTQGGLVYGNDIHLLARFRDGLIVEVREYFNTLLAAPLIAELKARAA